MDWSCRKVIRDCSARGALQLVVDDHFSRASRLGAEPPQHLHALPQAHLHVLSLYLDMMEHVLDGNPLIELISQRTKD